MRRSSWTWRLSLVAFLVGATTQAQYRPRPITEAEQAISEGDAAQRAARELEDHAQPEKAAVRWRAAADAYQRALADPAQAVAAAEGFGAACAALGEWPRVVVALAPIAAANPDAVEVCFHLGVALQRTGRSRDALPLLLKVTATEQPELFLAHYYLGVAALETGQGGRAVLALRRFLELRPKQLAAGDADIYEKMGRGYLLLRRHKDARAAFDFALRVQPGAVAPRVGIADTLEAEGKRAEAIRYLEGVLQGGGKRPPPVLHRLATLHLADGAAAAAEPLVAELLSAGEAPGPLLLSAQVRLLQKRYSDAERAVQRALALQSPPENATRLMLARILEAQGRSAEAVAILDEAARTAPDDVELLAALGTSLRHAGRPREAVAAHQRVTALAPDSPQGPLLLGADHGSERSWDLAIDDFQQALRRAPSHARARTLLSAVLARRAEDRVAAGALTDAVRDLRRALELEPRAEVALALGGALLATGAAEEARALLTRPPYDAAPGWQAAYLQGRALLAVGEPRDAAATLERALGLAGEAHPRALVSLALAAARLEAADPDAAVALLEGAPADPALAATVAEHLAIARLRRAAARVSAQDFPGAAHDLDAVSKSGVASVRRSLPLLQGVVALEDGRSREAAQAFAQFGGVGRAASPWVRPTLAAYVAYRAGRADEARKKLLAVRGRDRDAAEWSRLWAAASVRVAEAAYATGKLKLAARVLADVQAVLPSDLAAANNMACVQYQLGKIPVAVSAWERLSPQLPEAILNLGLHAHTRIGDPRRAVAAYDAYLSRGGPRSGAVREWKERLELLYFEPRGGPGGGR